MKRFISTMALGGLVLAAVALTGCGKDKPTSPVADAPQDAVTATRGAAQAADDTFIGIFRGFSRMMVVHAVPDAPPVDAFLGWRPLQRGLEFPDNSRYRWFFAGDRRVTVNVAGTSTTVIDETVPFQGWTNYSVFAIDSVASIEPLVVTDDLTRPAPGFAHVRFAHLSPNAPAVDVGLAGGGAGVFEDYSFRQVSDFMPLNAGTYDLEVRLAGEPDVVLPLPGIQLQDGVIYTVFARGFVGGTGDQALNASIIVNRTARRAARYSESRPEEGSLADL